MNRQHASYSWQWTPHSREISLKNKKPVGKREVDTLKAGLESEVESVDAGLQQRVDKEGGRHAHTSAAASSTPAFPFTIRTLAHSPGDVRVGHMNRTRTHSGAGAG